MRKSININGRSLATVSLPYKIQIIINRQEMLVFHENSLFKKYLISTAANGCGEEYGSFKSPRGKHIIRAKIGGQAPPNTVFVRRRPSGEIYSSELHNQYPDRDWILTRILWLSGQEVGKNRLGVVDTMRRYVYIHGTPDSTVLGSPGSKGCVRMHNNDIIELFDFIPVGTEVEIYE